MPARRESNDPHLLPVPLRLMEELSEKRQEIIRPVLESPREFVLLNEAIRESWAKATTLWYHRRAIRSPSSRTGRYGRQTWPPTRSKQSPCSTHAAKRLTSYDQDDGQEMHQVAWRA